MKRTTWIRVSALLVVAVLAVAAAQAQNPYIELLRTDIKADKVAILTDTLMLADEEGKAFWPLYREYDVELSALGDQRLALIEEFAKNFVTMTEDKADELAASFFKFKTERVKLLKKYHKKIAGAVSPVRAAQFVQLENHIGLLIDVQLSSEMPLLELGQVIGENDE